MTKLLVPALLATLASTSSVSRVQPAPAGWFAAGSRPNDYDMVVDRTVRFQGKPSARISSKSSVAEGFGTLMQGISADAYRQKRVRFSGKLRVKDVTGWASLWMRVDGPCNRPRAFDNAQRRALNGSTDWKDFEVVLDIAPDAQGIFFGTLLAGAGSVWVSDLLFETVDTTVPVTASRQGANRSCGPPRPTNLELAE